MRGLLLGLIIAVAAIALRLVAGSEVGRDQIVFSYPAVVLATLLFGVTAGATTAAICVVVAWYYVVPPGHSFVIRDTAAFTILAVDVLVSATLVAAIGTMKIALARYHDLALRLEQRVRERTAERNRLWERSPEYILIGAPDGAVTTANPAFEALLPGSARELNLFHLLADPEAAVVGAAFRRLSDGSASEAFETSLAVPRGETIVAWSAVRDGDLIYLVGRDVTAERECGEQLRQSHKVEAVGQMTGGLAHDLANYLTPILMSLELIRRRHPDDERTQGLVESASTSAERAHALVRRLLRFARRERSDPVRLLLREQLDAVVPLLQQTIQTRPLITDLADGLPAVMVDPTELDSALLNLAANARDATAPEGKLTLSARMFDDHHVLIEVADSGTGMDAATVARAREPFFSTKQRGEGTGLGLAMVQDFVQRSGGKLRIDSEPGVGTRVGIMLPTAI